MKGILMKSKVVYKNLMAMSLIFFEAQSVASDKKVENKVCDSYYTARFANMSDVALEKKPTLSLAEQFADEEADRRPLFEHVAESKKQDQQVSKARCKTDEKTACRK
jgi:hypothetical protein